MQSNPVEAALVATLLIILYLVTHGGIPIPKRFSVRAVLVWIAVVAIALGGISYCARH
ncbi:MAG TPA: hypothetical protein VHU84_10265 [Lacipirellulaceae bacterium]|jgi:hypothetical protein|nr:hypothetical protein [Lacipirellulaceae bacterium]